MDDKSCGAADFRQEVVVEDRIVQESVLVGARGHTDIGEVEHCRRLFQTWRPHAHQSGTRLPRDDDNDAW